MELLLNLGWMVLTALMYALWIYYGPRTGTRRQTQLVALALVVLILLPVISVTDDILMAQNAVETDCCQRKDHAHADPRATLHPDAAMLRPVLTEPLSGQSQIAELGSPIDLHVKVPPLDSIQNRPPPAA
jgi:hypothetical protein